MAVSVLEICNNAKTLLGCYGWLLGIARLDDLGVFNGVAKHC